MERMIFFGEESLCTAMQNFIAHYHAERHHQRLANQLSSPEAGHLENTGEVQRAPAPGRHAELTTIAPLLNPEPCRILGEFRLQMSIGEFAVQERWSLAQRSGTQFLLRVFRKGTV